MSKETRHAPDPLTGELLVDVFVDGELAERQCRDCRVVAEARYFARTGRRGEPDFRRTCGRCYRFRRRHGRPLTAKTARPLPTGDAR